MQNLAESIKKLRLENKTYRQIALELNCSTATVCYHLGEGQKAKNFERTCKRRKGLTQPKSKKKYYCSNCKTIIRVGYNKSDSSKYCVICNKTHNKNNVDWSQITVSAFKAKFKTIHAFNARIRSLARSRIELKPCKCGYSKHVEVCHIKPIASFDDNATIAEINSKENLVCMCPNCHWEFDHQVSAVGVAPTENWL